MEKLGFRPRRLGHVNLWVSELERSIDFYQRICGIHLVRREPGLRAGFLSNGNTHHDVALVEVSHGMDRFGRDGSIQVSANDNTVGLSHLGWEMESEADLVAAYQGVRGRGLKLLGCADHMISHSIYVSDPDGNGHEFYADAIPDWRVVFNLAREDDISADWDPLASEPSTSKYFPKQPALHPRTDAPLQPLLLTGATLATHNYDGLRRFMIEQAGLTLTETEGRAPRRAVARGVCGQPDITVVEARPSEPIGLRLFSFMLKPGCDFDMTRRRLHEAGAPQIELVDDIQRTAILLHDPDGFQIEFYGSKTGQLLESAPCWGPTHVSS
jgi:catechol 2,3-dioxygenase